MAKHLDLGILGEKLAKEYLLRKGYILLDQNWRHGRAEMDLVMRQDGKIIFVEVKTRRSSEHGTPDEFVDWKKEKQLEFASQAYIDRVNHQGEIRFDIIAIVFENEDLYQINHIEDAFWPDF
ncbi:MAG: YraN family protein [Pedobacter sp.]|nr:MAG: YraN family protein [Pedobacter sp.]